MLQQHCSAQQCRCSSSPSTIVSGLRQLTTSKVGGICVLPATHVARFICHCLQLPLACLASAAHTHIYLGQGWLLASSSPGSL